MHGPDGVVDSPSSKAGILADHLGSIHDATSDSDSDEKLEREVEETLRGLPIRAYDVKRDQGHH